MIEDCMNLLLDVEDIDRLCAASVPGYLPLARPTMELHLTGTLSKGWYHA